MSETVKIMSKEELEDFIEKVGRVELFHDLEDREKIRSSSNADINCLHISQGGKSPYIKAVEATLVSLGYDEVWVATEVDKALSERYVEYVKNCGRDSEN